MLKQELFRHQIVLDRDVNLAAYQINANIAHSEEAWLGIDLFNTNPTETWWRTDTEPVTIRRDEDEDVGFKLRFIANQ